MDSYIQTLMLDPAMTRTIATNFKRDPSYKAIDYMCGGYSVGNRDGASPAHDGVYAGNEDKGRGEALNRSHYTQTHTLRCPGCSKYQYGLNFEVQTDVLKSLN